MAYPSAEMVLTPEAQAFADEWLGPLDYIQAHTSGSTGSPKPVKLFKSDMRLSARATLSFFGLGSGSMLLLPLSPTYIAGKMQIVRAFMGGCSLICETPRNNPFATLSPDRVPTSSMVAIVPSQIEGLMQSPAFRKFGNILIGGASIPPHMEEKLLKIKANAWVSYGMTETCSHVALRKLGTTAYKPLPGFTFTLDSRGCLVISSGAMSFGQIVTNDMVHIHPDNSFEFLGRYDNVINSGGYKIHPEQVEKSFSYHIPQGYTAYVTSRASDKWGEEAVIVTDWPELSMDHLSDILSISRPKDIIFREAIPRTDSGKIIREKLR
ncbi:MAG: AMP-binding protein [Muribaculaceae bacterium]|nr:AMP-binding protein [Muribaculaceae bacterium]